MATPDFSVVYSLYLHDSFGFLIGVFAVDRNAQGSLTLRFHRITADNLATYRHKMDETDLFLFKTLDEISLNALFKTFGANENSLQDFSGKFLQKASAETKDYVLNYIERRKQQALPLLADRLFYRMSKDGYPAWKQLTILDDKAEIQFQYDRNEKETLYTAEVRLNGKAEELFSGYTGIVAQKPVWVVRNSDVFTFDEELDGKKLLPFTRKKTLVIPRSAEEEHFTKFMLPLLERYPINATGFEILENAVEPVFRLTVTKDAQLFVHFQLAAIYGEYEFSLENPSPYKARMEKTENGYRFYRIKRNVEREKEIRALYQSLRDEKNRLFDLSLKEQEAFEWLQQNHAALTEAGVQVIQKFDKDRFNLHPPKIDFKVEQNEDGFLVAAELVVGSERFPFADLRKTVTKGAGKFVLPDKSYVMLPPVWVEDLQRFFEIARETEGGYRLAPFHGPLLQALFQQQNEELGWQALQAFESIEKQPAPLGLEADLREYQAAGYDWLCFLNQYGLNGILADDMGLGKTVQTLALLQREKEQGAALPSLIIMPTSILFNWTDEAKKFTPGLKILSYTGAKRGAKRENFYDYDLIFTTYGLVRQDEEFLAKQRFNYVILDESHLIKNSDAKTTKSVMQLNARRRLSLTGTPLENSTADLWTQMQFLNPGLLGGANFFEKYYTNPIEKERNEARADKLQRLIRPFILRRTKEMVAKDLPDRIEQVHYCEMTEAQRRLYNDTRSLYKSTLFKDGADDGVFERNQMQILSCLQRLRQIAIHPQMIDPTIGDSGKYREALQMLEDVLAAGKKCIVFSSYVKFLNIIKYDLMKRHIPYSYIDGTTKDRKAEVDKFQHDDAVKVFLMSLKAGGVGLNLTKAEYVFIIDPWWNPAAEQQAIARAHRIGQTQTVIAYKFITKNSIEERILNLQQKKTALAGEIIKTEALFFKSLSKEELEGLFE